MRVKFLTVGKLKEKYLRDGIQEYQKRLSRFCQVEMIEVADERIPDKASSREKAAIIEKEGQKIEAKIQDRDFLVVLAIEGKLQSSEELSQALAGATLNGHSTLTFVIGGSLGLSDRIKTRANLLLSFGRMTLPHQLMKMILVEQVYRSFMIQEGSPYHK
ncbi:23S rRNA (pseudouridine(1915)-N(3))-methyltransferase RlmH [Streptococcus sp. NLN76]|uniref:23S rRNA (pseudouridine(1915)-N(3))-methyltransferase RlmH n=1 Tax=Streptococcus sp. NLN76 TaxID=2822800 RepID=UPI0018A9DE7D|nr:23S rRNA (pseudouridine(1915)-N(3))-methyltransferase RlmH [Streptococcus sp. NLN76]MBF8970787.1 23S rRNA (pseudouridine(1915)-N(3))-methyltransferase RlmH [Streptococcus sp. NLN76]